MARNLVKDSFGLVPQDSSLYPLRNRWHQWALTFAPKGYLGKAYMHHVRRQTAQSIAAAVPGTMGSVIAQATLQASAKLPEWTPSHDNLLQAGLEEIKGARGVADQTKSMANFALNIGQRTGPGHEKDFIVRKSLIEGIEAATRELCAD